jgi:hypothetical protein
MSFAEEKTAHGTKARDASPSHESNIEMGHVSTLEEPTKDGDEALHFLKNQHDVGTLTPEDEKKLVRRIDWMVMPLMWGCYCLQYLDKTLGRLFRPCGCAVY